MELTPLSPWAIACRIYGDHVLEEIRTRPIAGVTYIKPELYVEKLVEDLYFKREISPTE